MKQADMGRSKMRVASRYELAKLRHEAIAQLNAGGHSTTENAIKTTMARLMRERGIRRPPKSSNKIRRDKYAHLYAHQSDGLEQGSGSTRENSGVRKPENLGRFFIKVPEEYVKYISPIVRNTRATEVYLALRRYAGQDKETWVTQKTLKKRLGYSITTIRTAVEILKHLGIIRTRSAFPGQTSLDNKPIRKTRGYVYTLIPPEYWNWKEIRELRAYSAAHKRAVFSIA